MKVKYLILLFFVLMLGNTLAYGQSVTEDEPMAEDETVAEDEPVVEIALTDRMQLVIDSLATRLSATDVIDDKAAIDSLRKTLANLSDIGEMLKFREDSLMDVLSAKDKEIEQLQSNIGFVDTCLVKLANRWLYEKFDKESVEEAIGYFDRIYSSRLKGDLSIVQTLLRDYESAYREFQSILKEAQSDMGRRSPFGVEKYKKKYSDRIKSMPYYVKFYDSSWNIRYLNELIAKALGILDAHSDKEIADFSQLID